MAQTCGGGLEQTLAAAETLVDAYRIGRRKPRPDVLLCALHTYYALVVKLLLGQALAPPRGVDSPAARMLQAKAPRQLHGEVQRLESGETWQEFGLDGPMADPIFSWYADAWSSDLAAMVHGLARTIVARHSRPLTGTGDVLGQLYLDLFPRKLRHRLGEYYTPDWLVEHVLDRAGYLGEPGHRLLDPSCGSGAFLLAAIARLRRQLGEDADGDSCRHILGGVAGCELNPLAALSTRASCLMAVADLLPHAGRIVVPIVQDDAILGATTDLLAPGSFDYVVGNPPWVAWDNLPEDYRRATLPWWQQYGLFSLPGNAARHGGGKKDLAMLLLYASVDKYLADGGQLAMVVTQTLFQTGQAGEGFRRFRLGEEGTPLEVCRVDDLVASRPFDGAANWTAVVALRKGRPTAYPVPYVVWKPRQGSRAKNSGGMTERLEAEECLAEPIEPARPGSPWFVRPRGLEKPLDQLFGPSDYEGRLGANSGGANGVYWVEVVERTDDGGVRIRNLVGRGKQAVAPVDCVVEPDLLYPLLRWGDVGRYHTAPSAHLLLAQDVERRVGIAPDEMARRFPRALDYLERFEPLLRRRAAYRRYQGSGAFWSMYNVGTYTIAPVKVVWRRMDRRMTAAVVEAIDDPLLGRRVPVPQETCVLIAAETADEAHYLCGVLNSALVDFLVRSHSVDGGKGFGTPGMLGRLRIRRYQNDDATHAAMSEASRRAHAATAAGEDLTDVQRRIDELAARMWGLSAPEAAAVVKRSPRSTD